MTSRDSGTPAAPGPATGDQPVYPLPQDVFGATTVPGLLSGPPSATGRVTVIDRELRETPIPHAVLFATARRVAAGLTERGVRPGDRVALISSTSPTMLFALYGVWRAGAVPVILPLPHRLADLGEIMADLVRRLDHVDARCVVVADTYRNFIGRRLADSTSAHRPVLTCGELAASTGSAVPEVTTAPDDVAYLQFTSGTTGPPKAVTLTHRQMLTNAAACWTQLDVVRGESVLVTWLPLYHDMGLVSALAMLGGGGTHIIQPPEDYLAQPDSWVDALSRYGATHTLAPNFAYAMGARSMTERPRDLDLTRLRMCGDGAEPIRTASLDAFIAAGDKYGLRPEAVTPMYGMAEATLAVTLSQVDRPLLRDQVSRTALEQRATAEPADPADPETRELVICGHPIPGVEIRIADDSGAARGEREVGEIWVRGPSVMEGYWQDPEGSEATFRDGWLRTGDLGYLTSDGLVICGRIKDMIIVGGRNLYPEDYEQIAGETPGSGRVSAAFSLPDSERMIVAVEAAADTADPQALADDIMVRLRDRLGHAPDRVIVVAREEIPRTSSGKIQRGRCKQRYFAGELTELAGVDQ